MQFLILDTVPSTVSRRLTHKRRSARVQLRVQISIDTRSQASVTAETVSVSRHGAKIRITAPNGVSFTTGDRLRITVSNGHEPQTARIVWSRGGDAQYGIELDDPTPLWGVVFPSLDGEGKYERKPAKAAENRERTPTPAAAVAPAAPPSQGSEKPAPPLPAASGISVSISGLSSVRSPFSEVSELSVISSHEASILLKHLVDIGAILRIAGARKSTESKARVMNVSRRREAGKWRVRIKSENPLADSPE